MWGRTKWYFYFYEIKVKTLKKRRDIVAETVEQRRDIVVQRLIAEYYPEGPPKTYDDPRLITVRYRIKSTEDAKKKTTQLRDKFSECDVVECEGYWDHISRDERQSRKEKNAKRKQSLWYAFKIYLATVVGGGTIAGASSTLPAFFAQVTLQTENGLMHSMALSCLQYLLFLELY